MIHIGIDPGAVGAAVAMDDDGEVGGAVHWTKKHAWRLSMDPAGAMVWVQVPVASMVDALCAFVRRLGTVQDVVLTVEDVGLRKGKTPPITLATNAGIAIGAVMAVSNVTALHRPRPEAWRKVLTGKALAGRRADLKALAMAWARGEAYPGVEVCLHPGGRVLPDGPDHAAEAALMAWASVRGVV